MICGFSNDGTVLHKFVTIVIISNSSEVLQGMVSFREADLALGLTTTIELRDEFGDCQPKEQERRFHL